MWNRPQTAWLDAQDLRALLGVRRRSTVDKVGVRWTAQRAALVTGPSADRDVGLSEACVLLANAFALLTLFGGPEELAARLEPVIGDALNVPGSRGARSYACSAWAGLLMSVLDADINDVYDGYNAHVRTLTFASVLGREFHRDSLRTVARDLKSLAEILDGRGRSAAASTARGALATLRRASDVAGAPARFGPPIPALQLGDAGNGVALAVAQLLCRAAESSLPGGRSRQLLIDCRTLASPVAAGGDAGTRLRALEILLDASIALGDTGGIADVQVQLAVMPDGERARSAMARHVGGVARAAAVAARPTQRLLAERVMNDLAAGGLA